MSEDIGRREALKRGVFATMMMSAGGAGTAGATRGDNGDSSRMRVMSQASDSPWTQQAKLRPDDGGDSGDRFGFSVSLDGSTAVIGAGGDDTPNVIDAGSAYVFERTDGGWTQQAKLLPDDVGSGGFFGDSVSLDGSTAVIGAYIDEDPNGDRAGSAYVFERTDGGWTQQAKLLPDDGDQFDSFGFSVSLDGSTAVIGAYIDEDPNGSGAGSAYVFERTGGEWTQQAKLLPDDGDQFDSFGFSVSLDDSTAVIGAYTDEDPNGSGAGSAYVFERTDGGWTQQAKLRPDDGGDSDDRFGFSVSLDGSTAVIAADGDEDPNGSGAGSAYVFERTDGRWTQQAKLLPDDGDQFDSFGDSVSLDGSTAVIGAYSDDNSNGTGAGSAYVFERTDGEWTQQAKLLPDDGDSGDAFGDSVSLDDSTAVIGAIYDENQNDFATGSAYVFGLGTDFEVRNLNAPNNATAGDTITVTADVENVGDEASQATVEFRLDLDGDGTLDSDEVIVTQTTESLSSNETVPVQFTVDTTGIAPDTYDHGVFTTGDSETAQITIEDGGGGASLAERFDDGNGEIDRSELFDAIDAFQNGNLGRSALFDIIAEFQTEDPRWANVDG